MAYLLAKLNLSYIQLKILKNAFNKGLLCVIFLIWRYAIFTYKLHRCYSAEMGVIVILMQLIQR